MLKTAQKSAFAKFTFLQIFSTHFYMTNSPKVCQTDLNHTLYAYGKWTVIENVCLKLLKVVWVSGWGAKMSLLGWTGPHYIQHGGQTREFFKKAILSVRHFVLDGKNCTKIGRAIPKKLWWVWTCAWRSTFTSTLLKTAERILTATVVCGIARSSSCHWLC